MLTLFVIEKICQRWLFNRYGCGIEEVRKYKIMEERLRCFSLIKNGLTSFPINLKIDKFEDLVLKRELKTEM